MACQSRREMIRDRVAKAALHAMLRSPNHIICYWQPRDGSAEIEVHGAVQAGTSQSLGLLGGETSLTVLVIEIPRQGTGLCGGAPGALSFPPPQGFLTGDTVRVGEVRYAVNVTYDAETPEFAPIFRLECRRYEITMELDDAS